MGEADRRRLGFPWEPDVEIEVSRNTEDDEVAAALAPAEEVEEGIVEFKEGVGEEGEGGIEEEDVSQPLDSVVGFAPCPTTFRSFDVSSVCMMGAKRYTVVVCIGK